MELFLLRTSGGKESTLGQLYINKKPECFSLEDQFQEVKVKDETRIPNRRYKLGLREVDSPMTKRYRKKYPWFTFHIQVMDVPDFENVYIHSGVTDDHTSGCILVGDALYNNQAKVDKYENGALMYSSQAYERVYKKITNALMNSEEVTLDIYEYRV